MNTQRETAGSSIYRKGALARKSSLKQTLKRFLDRIGINNLRTEIKNILKHFLQLKGHQSFIQNVNNSHYSKKCLLVYITYPFEVPAENISDSHQNQKQAVEMARVIGTFGYNVDVAAFPNTYTLRHIKGKYDLIIDIQTLRTPDFWAKNMNDSCKLVIYSTGSSLIFSYAQEHKRLDDLERRRGVRLQPRRSLTKPGQEKIIESANAFWHIGNSYNLRTYEYLKLPPVYFIKNTGYNFGWVRNDIIRDKRSFVFFASGGQVHKGLDLLLEIFGREGFGCNLYVCSSFMNEEDFCSEYRRELFERPNIFPVGWVDINGQVFREVTEKCAYVIMPSCSEGLAGSVLTVMSAGVIPIVSKECGYDDDEAINLPDCRIETIEQYISEYSHKPDAWIREHSEKYMNIARTRFSFESFSRSVHDAMTAITTI